MKVALVTVMLCFKARMNVCPIFPYCAILVKFGIKDRSSRNFVYHFNVNWRVDVCTCITGVSAVTFARVP
jgi:hypothetical protein